MKSLIQIDYLEVLALEKKIIAHREGRTRSLQITALHDSYNRKSLTLYPIELGGR